MKTPTLLLGSLAILLSLAAHSADKVYKWKDANGVVHFTDTAPPQGTQFDNVQVKGGAAAITETKPEPGMGEPADSTDATQTAAASPDKARCDEAKGRVALLQSKSDVSMQQQDGKAARLSKEQRATELTVAQSQVTAYCGNAQSNK